MAHPQHDEIRDRYQNRCGYCGVTERETGGELTVDHYRPVSAGGDQSDDNLVYCCFRCNSYKADFEPSQEDISHGFRVLHPLLDMPTSHFRLVQQTGLVEPLTATGRFHVILLHLNRTQLVELRLSRRLHELVAESCRLLHDENEHLRVQIVMLEHYVQELRKRRNDSGEAVEEER